MSAGPAWPPVDRRLAAALLLVLAACAAGGGADITAPKTADTPTTAAAAAAPTEPADPDCPGAPPRRAPDPNRPRYVMVLDVRPAAKTVSGSLDVRFTLDFDTDRVVFRLWANGPRPGGFGTSLDVDGPVEVNGQPAAASQPDPTTLVLHPATGPIARGQPVRARLDFTLHLVRARDRISGERDSVRLGSFFPLLEWEPSLGWTTDPPTTRFAEASTAPAADFDLTITTPPGYGAVASGDSDRPGHWTATAMRDVSVAVGRFTTATGVARVPGPVEVIVAVDADAGESPQPYLERAVAVLEASSRRFGPYPWRTFAVSVTPGISTGIEYPGHVLHGPGTATDVLTHEVGHQWFYALVGNNQARDPWLDEALTTWVEARYEETVDDYQATAIPAAVRNRVTEPMTFWDRSDAFWLGAYVQGAQALAALGPAAQVDCALRIYANDNAYRVATASDLFAALARVFPDAPSVMARFGIRP